MLPHSDPHDPVNDDERLDGIVLAALGAPLAPDLHAHVRECPICSHDLQSMIRTVELVREDDAGASAAPRPPAGLWAGIAAAIAESEPFAAPEPASAPQRGGTGSVIPLPRREAAGPAGRRRPWRRVAAAAAALVIAAGIGVGGYVAGSRSNDVVATCETGQAALAEMPGGPAGVDGSAEVYCASEGRSLRVNTARLPLTDGFYEVWLYSPSTDIMVPIGTLGADGTGSFTLPAGVDLTDFHVIDVSHQQFNGDPTHDQSVLQGVLTN